jgi:hypothetical protein
MRSDECNPSVHEGLIQVGESRNHRAPDEVGRLEARFVRYPGCQQLTLWLPQPGHSGYGELRVLDGGGRIVEQGPLRERLNGSIQLLWDTLAWPPGAYRIEIDHADGWRHELALQKLAPHELAQPAAEPDPAPAASGCRDRSGQPIQDEDLQLRARAFQMLQRRFARRIEYAGTYRAGTLTYDDGEHRITLSHEMGCRGLKFSIDLPTEAQWQACTGVPLAERAEIVHFVAERVQRDQGMARFEIRAGAIDFY